MLLNEPDAPINMLGAYGSWAASLAQDPPELSLRHARWDTVDQWRAAGRERLWTRLAAPDLGPAPPAEVERSYVHDGLHVEELRWRMPHAPPTRAVLLKPEGARGRLPGVLALHCHSGTKYLGWEKIARTADDPHPLTRELHRVNYGGRAWANELARSGYVVLAHDGFAFGSRRVRPADVPDAIRSGIPTSDPCSPEQIHAYDAWAASHESVMAKSLFCAGTTWPGVTLAEDRIALDILCDRDDVDPSRVGVGGLSGGGLRSVFLAGADPRVACSVCAGMMTTWRDFLLHRSHTHTWMIYVPLLPRDLDYPEILGLAAPAPTMVLSNLDDPLFTRPGMTRAGEILGEVYLRAGAPDRYQFAFHEGGHKFDVPMQEQAFAWFDRWLQA